MTALIPPLWGKPVVAALLRSYLNRVQGLEDDIFEVLAAFDVNTCDATRLAILGKVVGQANFGWDLETYRNVVRARIAANRSHGLEEDILKVLHLAGGITEHVTITAHAPATLTIALGETITDAAATALDFLLPKTRAAGVQLHLFRPVDDPAAGAALTWGSALDASVGGDLDSTASPIPDTPTLYSVHVL
ncbi:MAG: hypothetical protein V4593_08370 [Pseudomonadota bacterium]